MSTLATHSEAIGASFRDPDGFVFQRDGVIYRQINQRYAENYKIPMESGLYKNLVERGHLLRHEEVQDAPVDSSRCFQIIRPEQIDFISYPYEWLTS